MSYRHDGNDENKRDAEGLSSEQRMPRAYQERRYLDLLGAVSAEDVSVLDKKNREYGGSWKRRGGVGAFMMLARKWDRLEEQVKRHHYDMFEAAQDDDRDEGVLDDIGDLRRYLLLVEAEILARRGR